MRNGTIYQRQPLAPLTAATASGSLPTPNARDYKDGPYPAAMARKSPGLGTIAHFPTPTVKANMAAPSMQKWPAHRNWATPTQSDGMAGPGNQGRDGGENLRTQVGGSLNPTWCSVLMGFPPDWTEVD